MANSVIPTVDLSPFFTDGDDEGKRKAVDIISQACSEYGFFQIVNHGVPLGLVREAMELSKIFFECSDHEKRACRPATGETLPAGYPLPTGYTIPPDNLADKTEYLLMYAVESSFNVFPTNPPQFKKVLEEMYTYFAKTGGIIESIINECLGLPPNFLKEYNDDRRWDLLAAMHYFPATENDNNGLSEHEDANFFTFVIQDEVGGLQVCKNGEWVPVAATEDTLVVNIGDVIQVLSNKKFKSPTHRVVRTKGRSRYSYGFFHSLNGNTWVEPLPQFTKDIREPPKYRGFMYKDYQQLRIRNKTHPPSKPEDVIHITHFAIPTDSHITSCY